MATVNISFQDDLLAEIDAVARREHRTRSDLVREAARLYLAREARASELFKLGDAITARSGLDEADVAAEVAAHRREYRAPVGARPRD